MSENQIEKKKKKYVVKREFCNELLYAFKQPMKNLQLVKSCWKERELNFTLWMGTFRPCIFPK